MKRPKPIDFPPESPPWSGYNVAKYEAALKSWKLTNKICQECNGEGTVPGKTGGSEGIPEADVMFVCNECKGTGKINKQ